MAATGNNCLAIVLRELGWSYTRLIAELRRHASVALPKPGSTVSVFLADGLADRVSKGSGRSGLDVPD